MAPGLRQLSLYLDSPYTVTLYTLNHPAWERAECRLSGRRTPGGALLCSSLQAKPRLGPLPRVAADSCISRCFFLENWLLATHGVSAQSTTRPVPSPISARPGSHVDKGFGKRQKGQVFGASWYLLGCWAFSLQPEIQASDVVSLLGLTRALQLTGLACPSGCRESRSRTRRHRACDT